MDQTASKFVMTKQRRAVLDVIRQLDGHPDADEIFRRVRSTLPRISLGTVYRTLDLLSESGHIRRLDLGGCHRRFDNRLDDHFHFRCVRCDRLYDIDPNLFPGLTATPEELSDFLILDRQLELHGLCPRCRAEEKADDAADKAAVS